MEKVRIKNIVEIVPTGKSAIASRKTPSEYSCYAHMVLTHREVRYIMNSCAIGQGSRLVCAYAKTYGALAKNARESEVAYVSAFCLGLGNLAFNMFHDQYDLNEGKLERAVTEPALYTFSIKLPLTEEQYRNLNHEMIDEWVLPCEYIYVRMNKMQRIPIGLSELMPGIASFMLQDEFCDEEEAALAEKFRREYCWINDEEAHLILDRWFTSHADLKGMHEQGIYR